MAEIAREGPELYSGTASIFVPWYTVCTHFLLNSLALLKDTSFREQTGKLHVLEVDIQPETDKWDIEALEMKAREFATERATKHKEI